jgi:cytochrome c oxidase assembly factor CtaG
MTSWQLFISTWNVTPPAVLACAAMMTAYLALVRFRVRRRAVWFILGIALLFFSLVSPLAVLGHHYLFSAHMVQHLLLVLVVPQLLLSGIPAELTACALIRPAWKRIEGTLGRPLVGWLAGAGAMWVWHVPAAYNAAMASRSVMMLEHASLVILGTIFWWPILAPRPDRRLAPLLAVLYLFTACLSCTVLGITLTFAPAGAYPGYLNPRDTLGVLPLLRDRWGLSPATDQQLGGLIMWVPACVVYVSAIVGVLARWYTAPDIDQERTVPVGLVHESPLPRP